MEVLEIVEYYESKGGPQLADLFTSELKRYIESLAERPESYGLQIGSLRRANLNRFPYHVLFRIVDDETIKIIAVKHNRRRPGYGTRIK